MVTDSSIAWWIAFGPHGPRAETPPGEWTKVWLYTAAGVGLSAVLFFGIHSLARPPPRTMTKEWQEATNEYLKVSFRRWSDAASAIPISLLRPLQNNCADTIINRPRRVIPSTVSAVKDTAAKVTFKASPQRLKASVSMRRSRKWSKDNRLLSLTTAIPLCTVTSIERTQQSLIFVHTKSISSPALF